MNPITRIAAAVAFGALVLPPPAHASQAEGELMAVNGILGVRPPPGSPLGRRAGLVVEDVALPDALQRLAETSKVAIAFSPSVLGRTSRRVSCSCAAVDIAAALDRLLAGTRFGYIEIDDQILISKRSGVGVLESVDPGVPSVLAASPALFPRVPARSLDLRELSLVGSITGQVTAAGSLQPLQGAQVHLPASGVGGLTNAQGRFVILNVPAGEHLVQVQTLGYVTVSQTVTVRDNAAAEVNFAMEQTALALGEIVVTGVAAATPQAELPFTVERVDFSRDMAVVPTSPEALLQGRIAGVSVVAGSGQPGEDADIVLRGATSITGSQGPLIIIDGVITSGRMSDINPRDIASIEVVKGAAASSLYGSRAQAGVINITTKRGATLADETTRFYLRSQYTSNQLPRPIKRTRSHPYRLTADGTAFADEDGNPITDYSERVLDDGGDGSNAMRTFAVNPYPAGVFNDHIKEFYSPGNQTNLYAAVEGRQGGLNYRLSASTGRDEGVIQYHNGASTQTFRLNVDHQLLSNLQFSFSGYYAQVEQDLIAQGESGILRSISSLEPIYDLLEIDPADGELKAGVGPPGEVTGNLLYQLKMDEDVRDRDRFMGAFQARYTPLSWLVLEGNVSYDRSNVDERHYRPRGFKHVDSSGEPEPPDEGYLRRSETLVEEQNVSLTASITRTFGDFTSRSQLRYLYEEHEEDGWSGSGNEFSVVGVPRLSLLEGSTQLDSHLNRTVAEGFFAITSLGYQGKYLVDVLGRRDGSSLFGSRERWQNYYRFSGAWRMSRESWWPLPWITEFKPRYSVGTAGGRPRYEAQYQTYAVDRGQISPRILGNEDLKPEYAREREIGLDVVFGQRVSAQINYVDTSVEDQLLLTPLPGYYGFTAQWRNAGTLESTTWEASIEASLVERPDLGLTAFVNFDRTRQVISELGVPSYQIRLLRSTMYVVEGEPLGVFYGKKWAAACSDLGDGVDCADFDVNDDGYLVYVGAGNSWRDGVAKDLWGTRGESGGQLYEWGRPVPAEPWPQVQKIGDSEPDFSLSWGSTLRWKNFSASALFEGEFGPQLYSTTLQWESTSGIPAGAQHDQGTKSPDRWKPIGYYFTLYDVNINNSHWVRDASFVKMRELSLQYTFSGDQLARVLGPASPSEATVNLVGRNLHTWTKYEGYDPEVGRSDFLGSAVVGRIDEYSYPNFRSFGLDVQLTF